MSDQKTRAEKLEEILVGITELEKEGDRFHQFLTIKRIIHPINTCLEVWNKRLAEPILIGRLSKADFGATIDVLSEIYKKLVEVEIYLEKKYGGRIEKSGSVNYVS